MASKSGPANDFPALIRHEFSNRKRKNPKYSLRALAKSLGINPSTLSRILNHRQGLSEHLIHRVGCKLHLTDDEISRYQKLHKRTKSSSQRPVYLDTETFLKIIDLQYYAIMNLLAVDGFTPDFKWMAKKLRTSEVTVKKAWATLEQIGLIKKDADGKWFRLYADTTNIPEKKVQLHAYRDLQIQILQRAIQSLHLDAGDRRDNSALTIAVDSSLLPEAMRRITRFRRSLSAFLQSGKRKDQVYSLAIALFPLTELNSEAEGS